MNEPTIWQIITDSITSIGSIAAIVIAIIAIKFATKTSKHEILVSKVEEIYEITQELLYYYSSLILIYNQHEEFFKTKNSLEKSALKLTYNKSKEQFKNDVDIFELYKKTGRLKTLAQAYLTSELKLKVLAYNDLFEKLIAVTLYEQKMLQEMFYSEGFPDKLILSDYSFEIEVDLIKAIQIGKKPLSQKEISDYRSKDFKIKLGLK